MTAGFNEHLGNEFDRALNQARRIIHDNEIESLQPLLSAHPSLLSWRGDERHPSLVEMATAAYGDAFGPEREHWFTRGTCAELLIDAGAVVLPRVAESILQARAVGLLHMFERKRLLPRTLKFRAALGDLDAVRAALDENAAAIDTINEAFLCACRFKHDAVASLLLEPAIAVDPVLSGHLAHADDRRAFIQHFIDKGRSQPDAGLWIAFVMDRISDAAHAGDVTAFVAGLRSEARLLGDDWVGFQDGLIGAATLHDRGAIIAALLDLDPAIARRRPPPPSQAIEFALTYAKPHLLPLLTRIWPFPDDLPHAAGVGHLAAVKKWFDESGAPRLGDLERHFPRTSPHAQRHDDLHWGPVRPQHVLDSAFAWAVINRHFDVADFLLARGANINTDWNSHEPASILHHLVFLPDADAPMRYLIDRGIDLTITDYRWNATAEGWAAYAKNDPTMAGWLRQARLARDPQ